MKNYDIKKLKEYKSNFDGKRDLISIHTNHKGSLAKLSVDQNINSISIIDFKANNQTRGNHYHEYKDEYFYLIEGRVNAYFKDRDNLCVEHIVVEKGTLIHIKATCTHAFTTIEEGYAIEYCKNLSREIEGDFFYEEIV